MMKLFTWSGFPGNNNLKAFSLAEDVEQARDVIISSFSRNEHYDYLRNYITTTEPTEHIVPTGWVQEVGSQYI